MSDTLSLSIYTKLGSKPIKSSAGVTVTKRPGKGRIYTLTGTHDALLVWAKSFAKDDDAAASLASKARPTPAKGLPPVHYGPSWQS